MYFPNLKTSDSELRAVRFLDDSTKRRITPIFELTRSRKTKSLPNGSVHKRIEQLNEIYGKYKYILDLSTEEEIINSQIIDMFDEGGGYKNWINFLRENTNSNVYPCALYVEDGGKKNFQKQIERIVDIYGKVCLRTSVADESAVKLYNWTTEVSGIGNIITCGVLYFIEENRVRNYDSLCRTYIERVIGNQIPDVMIFPGSSFPRYVTDREGGGDLEGKFEALEITVERDLVRTFPNLPIHPSDFASVHPMRYPTGGGNWIPRIDIFDGTSIRYVRSRRDDGGYGSAAQSLDAKAIARLPDCWGKKQIQETIAGRVAGGSPSFWISVRINCWITQRASL